MKIFKFSSIAIVAFLLMAAFTPHLSAKGHHHHKKSQTFFGFSLNVNPAPLFATSYVVQPAVVEPVYETVTYIPTPPSYTTAAVSRPIVRERVIIERAQPRVYLQPRFSYWSY